MQQLTSSELKDFLDAKANQFENLDFIQDDPILLPHRFSKKEDIEIIGFLVATIAWGNRKSIIKSGERILSIMGDSPYEFIINYSSSDFDFKHRTFNSIDLDFFFRSLHNIYVNHGGLEAIFKFDSIDSSMVNRLTNFRNIFLEIDHEKRSEKHISNVLKNSACKRINMFLRWMVRPDTKGVDFGLWQSIKPSELYLPLDVHTSNNARRLGLIQRKQDDWKTVEELMTHLRQLCPEDPVKYDFALFGLGAIEKW